MMNPIDVNTAMFNIQGKNLEQLKRNSNASVDKKDESLKQAATEFEAVFITQLLEIMDSTVEKSDFLRGGQGEETFKSMLNEKIALEIASSPTSSFGLAEQIYQQMKDRV